ncbi:MAG: hypothetical protein RJA07_447 [Bacteroidota bacterium]|jgi:hypothetical protein
MLKFKLTILVLLMAVQYLFAQHFNDNEMWLWVQGNKGLNKKLSIGLQYQMRLDNNLSTFKWSYYYLNVDYKLSKKINSQFVFQYGDSYDKILYSYFVALSSKKRIGKFAIAYRTAFQHEQNSMLYQYSREMRSEPVNEWRNRITLKYTLHSKIKMYAFSEPYIDFETAGIRVSKIRNSIGLEYEFLANNFINPFFLYQPDIIVMGRPIVEKVLGITYEFDLPYKKHKHKKHKKKDDDEPNDSKENNDIFH